MLAVDCHQKNQRSVVVPVLVQIFRQFAVVVVDQIALFLQINLVLLWSNKYMELIFFQVIKTVAAPNAPVD